MQLTSEDYFGPMGFVGTAKTQGLEAEFITLDKEMEAEYPSSLLEPTKLQSVNRHFETSFLAPFGQDRAFNPPTQSPENEWSLSRLYSNQRIGPAEVIAERVVNSLQSIPPGQRIQVYVSLLGKIEEKVREQRVRIPRQNLLPVRQYALGRIEERDKGDDKNGRPTELEGSKDAPEKPLYETVSAELWSKMFQEWASSHRKLSYEADDSRETIYEGRG
ncbi:MAG TPA: hypothetical protein VJP89_19995 [Pyrinomonadaceae bacterium]|nr:hypothetical protein [Pyrinomonadaceae bacterium]